MKFGIVEVGLFALFCLVAGYAIGMSHWGMKSWQCGWDNCDAWWKQALLKYDPAALREYAERSVKNG